MTLGHSGPVLQGNSAGWVARGAGRGAGPARKPRPGRGQVSRGLSRAQVRQRRSCSQVRTIVRGKEPAWAQVGTQRGFWGWAHCSGGQAEAGRGAGPPVAARRRAGTPEPALAAAGSRPLPHPGPYLTPPALYRSARSSPTPPVLFPRTLPAPSLLPRLGRLSPNFHRSPIFLPKFRVSDPAGSTSFPSAPTWEAGSIAPLHR